LVDGYVHRVHFKGTHARLLSGQARERGKDGGVVNRFKYLSFYLTTMYIYGILNNRKGGVFMGVMKDIYTQAKEVCSWCKSNFCEGCKISLQVRNDRVVLNGVTREVEEVEKDFFKGVGV
jgi:hypothetical protein